PRLVTAGLVCAPANVVVADIMPSATSTTARTRTNTGITELPRYSLVLRHNSTPRSGWCELKRARPNAPHVRAICSNETMLYLPVTGYHGAGAADNIGHTETRPERLPCRCRVLLLPSTASPSRGAIR